MSLFTKKTAEQKAQAAADLAASMKMQDTLAAVRKARKAEKKSK